MSTFAKKSFDAVAYAASRPHYPPKLYKHILATAYPLPSSSSTSSPSTILDLGCGPGLSTFEFIPHFDRVVGLDPGGGMVQAARGIANERQEEWRGKEVRFEVGKGEDLAAFEDQSVDLAVAAQAAHWFDHGKVYKELKRVLKPGGSFAYWGYGEMFFPKYPKMTKLIPAYSAGTLGKYWQQPGRKIVEDLLRDVPFPINEPSHDESSKDISSYGQWDPASFTRTYFVNRGGSPAKPDSNTKEAQKFEPLLLVHRWGLKEIKAYLRTWSAAHSYNEAHGEGSDVVAEMMDRVRAQFQREFIEKDAKVDVAWKMAVLSGKKAVA